MLTFKSVSAFIAYLKWFPNITLHSTRWDNVVLYLAERNGILIARCWERFDPPVIEMEWHDKNGTPNSGGAFDATGNYYAERAA